MKQLRKLLFFAVILQLALKCSTFPSEKELLGPDKVNQAAQDPRLDGGQQDNVISSESQRSVVITSRQESSNPDDCDMTTNIALNRPSQQSSIYYFMEVNRFLRASFANDDNTFAGGLWQCCHTDSEEKPYWYVELPATHRLCAVKITNRGDSPSAASRLGGAKVVVSDRNPSLSNRVETLCATVGDNPTNGEVITLTCDEPIPASEGRFLVLYIPRTEFLHICDFQAFTTVGTSPAFSNTTSLCKECDWTNNIARDTDLVDVVDQISNSYHTTTAARAVDGNYQNDNWHQCSQTSEEDKPWWAIRFNRKVEVCGVKILQKGDSLDASNNALIKVGVMAGFPRPSIEIESEVNRLKICGSLPATIRPGDLNYVSCEAYPVKDRVVVIYSPTPTYLSLCEVEIYIRKA